MSGRNQPILPGNTVGVLGSGQLGRMFAIAARRMGYRVHTLSPDHDTPTGQVADLEITADYDDLEAVRAFASAVSAVTFEFENVPAITAQTAGEFAPVRPAGQVLHITQHRLREKDWLAHHGFPLSPYRRVRSLEELETAVHNLSLPAVLKSADFGYDGKGQCRLHQQSDIAAAWEACGPGECVLEAFVDFECEISVVGVRSYTGEFRHYGAIQNRHKSGILDISSAPAAVDPEVAAAAIGICAAVLEQLDVVGVLTVEFFVTRNGHVLINELAPRPHNSGHLTVDAHSTSQFEQQLRAVCLLPLGSPDQWRPAAMANLLGDLWSRGEPDWEAAAAAENVKLHLYGKSEARAGRKMGHLTALSGSVADAVANVAGVREKLVPRALA